MLPVVRSALVAAFYLTAGVAAAGTTLTSPDALDKAQAGESGCGSGRPGG